MKYSAPARTSQVIFSESNQHVTTERSMPNQWWMVTPPSSQHAASDERNPWAFEGKAPSAAVGGRRPLAASQGYPFGENRFEAKSLPLVGHENGADRVVTSPTGCLSNAPQDFSGK